jgi:2',3'-cyclic-nucleotide 2'-phosphodiesterase (5'-nucleotidase family)
MNKVISVSANEMYKKKPESNLTNFLADVLLEEAGKECSAQNLNITPAVSFFNYGGIRAPLPRGEITVGNIFELMPFENEMVFLLLKGDQVQEFMNYVAYNGGGSVGGASFSIKEKKAINGKINGEKIDPEKSYWLVTNDYVAAGGDGLGFLRKNEQFVKSGRKIRDLIIENMQSRHDKKEKINIELDGRIRYE